MFHGAKNYGPKQFGIVMGRAGGNHNACTSQDLTVYPDFISNAALAVTFGLEADRIQDLAFDLKLVESEGGVVHGERRLIVDDNNAGVLNEKLWAAAIMAHP